MHFVQEERRKVMKCFNCGYESEQDFQFCPFCSAQVPPPNPAANKVLAILKDKLFLTICILLSIVCSATVFNGNSLPVTTILAVIFLWITYAKGRNGFVNVSTMRAVSGVVYAEYVITNVVAVILAVVGVLMGILAAVANGNQQIMQTYFKDTIFTFNKTPIQLTEDTIIGICWIFAGLFVFISAITLVVNIFAWKKLHGFVKSVYKCVESGGATPVINADTAKTWLWVFGIFTALGVLVPLLDANPWMLLYQGCTSASYIIGAILVDRHFVKATAE